MGGHMNVVVIGRGESRVAAVCAALRGHGVTATGATTDAGALALLKDGATDLVIGAGVERRSRKVLEQKARQMKVRVIPGSLGGRAVDEYVREDLLKALGRS